MAHEARQLMELLEGFMPDGLVLLDVSDPETAPHLLTLQA